MAVATGNTHIIGARAVSPTQDRDGTAAVPDRRGDYTELKRRIVGAGLLNKRPATYAFRVAYTLAALAAVIAVLVFVSSPVFVLADAFLLALVFGQLGFVAHDSGHRQVFKRARHNYWLCLAMASSVGLSATWWTEKHNRHHANTNEIGGDPDLDLPLISFTVEQARQRTGVRRVLVRFQVYVLLFLLGLEGFGMQIASIVFLVGRRDLRSVLEGALLALHHAVYIAGLFFLLNPGLAVAFLVLNHGFAGIYMGMVFAPNHKGMPVLESGSELDFLTKQVMTTRNVRSHPLIDLWYGGLNYQVEHHLFQSMPRSNLKLARPIVAAFCAEKGLPCHETGVFRSYVEIVGHLRAVSRAV